MATVNNSTKVVTGKVRLSYTHIFEPHAMDSDQEAKYSTAILIPKEDTATVNKIKGAIKAVYESEKNGKFKGKTLKALKTPLRDGDEEKADDENYAGHYFLNASSRTQPGIYKPVGKQPDGRPKLDPIEDSTEVYSGCYAKVSLNFYAYNKGSIGIAAGLNHVVKIQDGEPLGGRTRAEDDFADTDFDLEMDDYGDDDDFM